MPLLAASIVLCDPSSPPLDRSNRRPTTHINRAVTPPLPPSPAVRRSPFIPQYWSHRGVRSRVRSLSSVQMESASTTVPSIVVYVTVPNREAGNKLAGSIISEKLAACVNIVPGIQSVYWWEGKVQSDAEELLIIKTRESLLDALTEHVKANNEYDVPEVIALPIQGGNMKYLEWLKNSTKEN
ncbi:hypothetical protein BS78_01G239900 [Paspalum vaginatum]|nr:hypothetical protein BS78_01G239900 [Paspalum vaginatum]